KVRLERSLISSLKYQPNRFLLTAVCAEMVAPCRSRCGKIPPEPPMPSSRDAAPDPEVGDARIGLGPPVILFRKAKLDTAEVVLFSRKSSAIKPNVKVWRPLFLVKSRA